MVAGRTDSPIEQPIGTRGLTSCRAQPPLAGRSSTGMPPVRCRDSGRTHSLERVFDDVLMVPSGAAPAGPALRAADVAGMVWALRGLDREVSDHERIDQLRALEELKNAAAACQARIAADLRRVPASRAGVPRACRSDSAGQRRRARRSRWPAASRPHRGGRYLGLAKALVREMPHTLLRHGDAASLSEWRATLIARETACLERAHRAAHRRRALRRHRSRRGPRRQATGGGGASAGLQARPSVRRSTGRGSPANERRVTIRPAPDTMCYLTALLPVGAGRGGVRRADPRRRQRARSRRSAGQGAGHGRHPGRAVDRPGGGRVRCPSGSACVMTDARAPRRRRRARTPRGLRAGAGRASLATMVDARPARGTQLAASPLRLSRRPASSWPWTPGPTASREASRG